MRCSLTDPVEHRQGEGDDAMQPRRFGCWTRIDQRNLRTELAYVLVQIQIA